MRAQIRAQMRGAATSIVQRHVTVVVLLPVVVIALVAPTAASGGPGAPMQVDAPTDEGKKGTRKQRNQRDQRDRRRTRSSARISPRPATGNGARAATRKTASAERARRLEKLLRKIDRSRARASKSYSSVMTQYHRLATLRSAAMRQAGRDIRRDTLGREIVAKRSSLSADYRRWIQTALALRSEAAALARKVDVRSTRWRAWDQRARSLDSTFRRLKKRADTDRRSLAKRAAKEASRLQHLAYLRRAESLEARAKSLASRAGRVALSARRRMPDAPRSPKSTTRPSTARRTQQAAMARKVRRDAERLRRVKQSLADLDRRLAALAREIGRLERRKKDAPRKATPKRPRTTRTPAGRRP